MKKTSDENSHNPYIVPALSRGIKLIELLAENPQGLSVSDMERLNVPVATLFRMLTTLFELGYVLKNDNNTYRLTGKLLTIANKSIENTSLTTAADESMRWLRDKTGESVMLAVLHGNEGVVLHQVASNQPVKVILEIGHHFPLHTAAPAKAILAFLPEARRKELIDQISFVRFTKNTITDRNAYQKELDAVRETMVAYDRGEEMESLCCVASPIFDHHQAPVASIWINGPASRMSELKIKQFEKDVKQAAERISNKLK